MTENGQDKWKDSLSARLRAGERTAASELVDMYYRRIYIFMRRLGHNRQNSEDLTQESFMSAWRHIGQLRQGKALNGWLYRIAANTSGVYWRKHKNRQMVSLDGIELSAENCGEIEHFEQLDQLQHAVGGADDEIEAGSSSALYGAFDYR